MGADSYFNLLPAPQPVIACLLLLLYSASTGTVLIPAAGHPLISLDAAYGTDEAGELTWEPGAKTVS